MSRQSPEPDSYETTTLAERRREEIRTLIPEAFDADGGFDVEALKLAIGIDPERAEKRFGLVWPGKEQAAAMVNAPQRSHLRPDPNASIDYDTTQNAVIEADNLAALRLMQNAYAGQVKLIYLDPPYNTGGDFVYRDSFSDPTEAYLSQCEASDDAGRRTAAKSTSESGRTHSNWLSFMYPRLVLARRLLRHDGLIAISIDDNEQHHLRTLLNEIFGEENFLAQIAWRRTENQANIGDFARVKEYVLLYAKDKSACRLHRLALSERAKAAYSYTCSTTGKKFRRGNLIEKTRGRHHYPVKLASGATINGPWMVDEGALEDLRRKDLVYESSGAIYTKIYLDDVEGQIPNDFWGSDVGTNQDGTDEMSGLFKRNPFPFPKPTSLLSQIISIGSTGDDIVMDFFAGSGSTGHAVWLQNARDGSSRRFILATLPEPVVPGSVADEIGYKVVSDITLDRLSRASEQMTRGAGDNAGDVGFRVFRLLVAGKKQRETHTFDLLDYDSVMAMMEFQKKLATNRVEQIDRMIPDYLCRFSMEAGYRLDATIRNEADDIWKIDQDNRSGWIVIPRSSGNLRERLCAAGAASGDEVLLVEREVSDSDLANCSAYFRLTTKRI